MPVLSFQMTKEIELETLRKFNPNFVCPQMYYYLDNYPELFDFIWKNAKDTDTLPTPSETEPLTTGKLSRFMPSTKSKHPKN